MTKNILIVALALAVVSCGGGSGTGGTYSIGGTLSSLSGVVVLQNNGVDNLSLNADGSFEFGTLLANGAAYSVTVATHPEGQTCIVTNGSGTVAGGNVTNVAVLCGGITVGNGPVFSTVTKTGMKVSWTAATSATTAEADLQYELVYSTSDNISTVADAEANGTVALSWSPNTLTNDVSGLLQGVTYYFNVLVKGLAGNKVAYGTASQAVDSNPSCVGGLACAAISCCAAETVSGGSFVMGSSGAPFLSDTEPQHNISISNYDLDLLEVTVGRFRQYVEAYDSFVFPSDGDGANPYVPGTGWHVAWNANVAPNVPALRSQLNCDADRTWTDTVGDNEDKPINCVSWYDAFLFCYWDGGRLPTESEWEYASAGGANAYKYPWGNGEPEETTACCNVSGPCVVHSYEGDVGTYGQYDMGGNVNEWVFDWYLSDWYSSCSDDYCVQLTTSVSRDSRGGSWYDTTAINLSSHYRYKADPTTRSPTMGIRCARD